MADGKWIPGLRPEMPVTTAAREVLTARLEVVRRYLPRAIAAAERDPEFVHQLRVGTRRADAALRIFRECLPGRIYRAARQRLRTIRRAAGAARDWDVFVIALRERLEEEKAVEVPGLDFLVGYALGQRQAAQATLEAVEQNVTLPFDEFFNQTIDELRSANREVEPALIDLARPTLRECMQRLTETASGNLKDYEQLHQVRIAGKRLRYAMEVFAACFPASFAAEVYPQVEQMQEVLGRANDSHVANARLSAIRARVEPMADTWGRVKGGIEALIRSHQRRLPQERRRFVEWWQQWQPTQAEGWLTGGE